jgi:hypothetical protein
MSGEELSNCESGDSEMTERTCRRSSEESK